MLGILGGTSFVNSDFLKQWDRKQVFTPYGSVEVYSNDKAVFIARQGENGDLPPHRINHHVHLHAFKTLGVSKAVSFGSVGGLKDIFPPGTLLVASDFYSPHKIVTFRHDKIHLLVPSFAKEWRDSVVEGFLKADLAPVDNGVYAETLGPRFETVAEIKALARDADVVGMTCASEAILAQELEIPHCIVTMVDNYAHGIGQEQLTGDAFHRQVKTNQGVVLKAFEVLLSL